MPTAPCAAPPSPGLSGAIRAPSAASSAPSSGSASSWEFAAAASSRDWAVCDWRTASSRATSATTAKRDGDPERGEHRAEDRATAARRRLAAVEDVLHLGRASRARRALPGARATARRTSRSEPRSRKLRSRRASSHSRARTVRRACASTHASSSSSATTIACSPAPASSSSRSQIQFGSVRCAGRPFGSTVRRMTGTIRLPVLSAWASSSAQTSDATDSGLSTATTTFDASMPRRTWRRHAAPGGMSSRST